MSQQKAKEAAVAFDEFIKVRDAAGDWSDWIDAKGEVISPSKVSEFLGIGAAALRQNPKIKAARAKKESELREAGILKYPSGDAPKKAESYSNSGAKDRARMKSLEDRNAELREEVAELKATLKKANLYEEHLLATGRALPV